MPYLNSLLDRGALLTNFYANFHPSQPNYFALTTGQSFYTKEGPIPAGTNNIVRALATKSKTWKGYFTDVTTHEAVFRYFPEVWQNPAQLANIVPIFPNFMRDVTAGSLPSYSLIHDLPDGEWPQLYRWRRVHGAGGRSPQGHHRRVHQSSVVCREQRFVDRRCSTKPDSMI